MNLELWIPLSLMTFYFVFNLAFEAMASFLFF